MNRRSTLATLLGRQPKAQQPPAVLGGGLTPYTGTWGTEQAAHLLRRTTFGPTYAQIKKAMADGLSTTLDLLFADQPLPDPPVYINFMNDPDAASGETWINAGLNPSIQGLNGARQSSLRAWHFGLFNESGTSIREQMVLFWHNHFVVADITDARATYKYINFIRENATGNFRELAKGITIDSAMLGYLNGNENSAVAPNENYARELLELFTIGKGDLAGPGDYTTFTEQDVVEMAKVLTGWISRPRGSTDLQATFIAQRHDTSVKQLSNRFNSVSISNAGDQEYAQLIDIIFQKEEVARFISRKLYRWFVHYTISDTTEMEVIEPMAQLLIQNDYDIQPALQALLCSEHFFAAEGIGCMIKHPISFLFSMINTFEVKYSDELLRKYRFWAQLYRASIPLEMEIYSHPSVAGWKAYYQEPLYYRIWINSATLPVRMQLAETLVQGFNIGDTRVGIDVLEFTAKLDNPSDINALLAEISSILYARPLTQEQLDYLKDIVLSGLPDFEWNVEYSEYASDPTNQDLRDAIQSKLRSLILGMINLSEFYLS